jgi:hypothetical protein
MTKNIETLTLEWIPGKFAVTRYPEDAEIPPWALDSHVLMTVTRTHDALSIIAPDDRVPFNVKSERGFVALRILERLDFNLFGILAKLARALADAHIPILAVSTYDTDIILFKKEHRARAVDALSKVADVSRLR